MLSCLFTGAFVCVSVCLAGCCFSHKLVSACLAATSEVRSVCVCVCGMESQSVNQILNPELKGGDALPYLLIIEFALKESGNSDANVAYSSHCSAYLVR